MIVGEVHIAPACVYIVVEQICGRIVRLRGKKQPRIHRADLWQKLFPYVPAIIFIVYAAKSDRMANRNFAMTRKRLLLN